MSPTYRKRIRARLLARSLSGVEARERKRIAARAAEPVREWEFCRRVTDEAAYRTRRIVEMHAMDHGDGRRPSIRITENGDPTRFRSWASAMRALGRQL